MFGRSRLATKTPDQIARMRRAGLVVGQTLQLMAQTVRPGITTKALDELAEEHIRGCGAVPSFLGYHGFTGSLCTSVNDEVVHGIPGSRVLEEGDVLSIDCGAVVRGYHGDAAFTTGVGTISAEAQRLIDVADASLAAAIEAMDAGNRLGDIGHAVQSVAEAAGFGVLREYVGHGIGTAMHEAPDVPNYGEPGTGIKLVPGMVLAVEPMLTVGTIDTVVLDDGWSVVTADGKLSAHVEHSIAITDHGPEVLTLP
jgi:methionyl aminopeptidase